MLSYDYTDFLFLKAYLQPEDHHSSGEGRLFMSILWESAKGMLYPLQLPSCPKTEVHEAIQEYSKCRR